MIGLPHPDSPPIMAYVKALVAAVCFVAAVAVVSSLVAPLWEPSQEPVVLTPGMTLREFRDANGISTEALSVLMKGENPRPYFDLPLADNTLAGRMSAKDMQIWIASARAEAKNWPKILVKFALWFVFLAFAFVLMRRSRITSANRKWLYLAATVIFGVILGSDPSPMGTVKDAAVRLAVRHDIFVPRLVAFGVFLLMTVVASRFICSWGCQMGTMQDFLFRLGRDSADRRGAIRQFKLSFAATNFVRIAFFAAFTVVIFAWVFDIAEDINPFKVFSPAALSLTGGIFIFGILISSVFVYRPGCHLLCPFGLVAWLVEKVAIFRIRVDRGKCISCGSCEKACPSNVMGAILHRDKLVIPDCYSCGTCVETCPVKAISFSADRREEKHGAE